MIQQFRRAIGCETVRGQAKLMLGRLHYVRATWRKQRLILSFKFNTLTVILGNPSVTLHKCDSGSVVIQSRLINSSVRPAYG